jgi:hypothetical protein
MMVSRTCSVLRRTAILILLVLLAISGSAQAGTGDPRAEAKADLVKGMTLLDQGEYAEALKKFEAAYALVPSPKISFNMGLALQGLARNVQALESFERFLAEAKDAPRDKRDQAERFSRDLREKVASVTISSEVEGLEVFVDGTSRGTTPLAGSFYVETGAHQIVAQRAGQPPQVQSFTATAGGTLTIPLVASTGPKAGTPTPTPVVVRESPPPVPQPTPISGPPGERQPADWRTPTAWATGIGAIALAATGVVAIVIRGQKSDQLAQKTGPDMTCAMMGSGFSGAQATACADLANSRETWTGVAIAAFATAAAAGAATALLVVTRPNERKVSLVPRVVAVPDRRSPLLEATWRF